MTNSSLEARWGDDLLDYGFLCAPVLLIRHYRQLGLSDGEFIFVLESLCFRWTTDNPYPSFFTIATTMERSKRRIQQYATSLEKKKLLERKPRLGSSSELDFSPLLAAMRKLLQEMKNSSPPETSCTPGVKNPSPPPGKNLSPRTRSSKKETKEKKIKPVLKPPPTPAEAAEQEERFLDSLQSADEVEGIRLIQEHWRMSVTEGELPAKTAAYWLFAHPKGNWDYLEKHGQDKAVQLIKQAMDKAFERHQRGKIRDLIGYLNKGIQGNNSYLIGS